jgi:hypothetical protein
MVAVSVRLLFGWCVAITPAHAVAAQPAILPSLESHCTEASAPSKTANHGRVRVIARCIRSARIRCLDHPRAVWFTSTCMTKLHLGLWALLGGALFWACTTGEGGMLAGGQGGSSTSVFSGGTTGTDPGVGATGNISITTTGTNVVPDGGIVDRHAPVCDADGKNCKCTRLVSLGATATYGNGSDSVAAFLDWLNNQSTAIVEIYKTRQTLDSAFLDKYDVIILQDLRGWSFSSAEVQALEAWVRGGGGVMALSGYYSDDSSEITPTNALLSFTGMALKPDEIPGQQCPETTVQNVCPNASSACCYCWGNAIPETEWNTTHPIALHMTRIGGYRGRAVNPGDGELVISYSGTPTGATKTVDKGRVFLFGDEWITYTSQWLAGGQVSGNPDQWNPCYDLATTKWRTADNVFQTMQFWYNSLHYVAPPSTCNFVIEAPDDKIILL